VIDRVINNARSISVHDVSGFYLVCRTMGTAGWGQWLPYKNHRPRQLSAWCCEHATNFLHIRRRPAHLYSRIKCAHQILINHRQKSCRQTRSICNSRRSCSCMSCLQFPVIILGFWFKSVVADYALTYVSGHLSIFRRHLKGMPLPPTAHPSDLCNKHLPTNVTYSQTHI